ncbi:flavodoxin family protein [Planctobacterium marinum]|uniref:flavodoxin family protein n=1 Tax=Planctobacterium marinum TaxID=1631968 RepID=UPI001E3B478C|nr:flavodoxin family protein [Planctobacterium marinum]MCC2605742.1 flavodoxin family protein [Planctobacterium marinum]
MVKIAVVYFSGSGNTCEIAASISKGALSVDGTEVFNYRINAESIVGGRFSDQVLFNTLYGCQAIIFGTPTYMGNVAAQFKAFADATSDFWYDQIWAGKLAAGFTSGIAPNGDQTSTLQYLVTLSSQHGMLWVGLDTPIGKEGKMLNRLGCQLGVAAQINSNCINPVDHNTARYLGTRVASLSKKLI